MILQKKPPPVKPKKQYNKLDNWQEGCPYCDRIIELLENLLLCNIISNKKTTKKKHGILTGGPSKCDVNTLTVQLFFVQPSRSGPVHMK